MIGLQSQIIPPSYTKIFISRSFWQFAKIFQKNRSGGLIERCDYVVICRLKRHLKSTILGARGKVYAMV